MKTGTNAVRAHCVARVLALPLAVVSLAFIAGVCGLALAQPADTATPITNQGDTAMLGDPIETDPDSGARVYLLGGDERPADNIYGEQPYGDPSGQRIAIRYYNTPEQKGGISIVDLLDGSCHEVLRGKPPFPAFHPWAEWLYYRQSVDAVPWLRRCNYLTLEVENVAVLPPERGRYSYGTVSPDHRYFAVSVVPGEGIPAQVHLLDIETDEWSVLLDMPGYHAKHEQFSRDGRNRVLIQLNQMPDVKQVLLGEIEIGGEMRLFPADQPHTPRPTGHEAWIGNSSTIFYSTGTDPEIIGNVWTGRVGDPGPTLVPFQATRIGHVAVSSCGRYWVGDTGEEGVPIYIGSFETGRYLRAAFSRTVYDGKQWAHAHPYLTADNKWLIFTARRGDRPQVYGARLADGWLESL